MGSLVMIILLAMYLPLFYMIGNMGPEPGCSGNGETNV
jgi:hypothetical protein